MECLFIHHLIHHFTFYPDFSFNRSDYSFSRLDEDLVVNGYKLKKGDDLTINMSSILNDPETFPNPTKFDPERFLGEEGHLRTQRMIPFGIGEFFHQHL